MTNSLIGRVKSMRILGASLIGAGIIFGSGIIAWGGFNTAMEATNTLGFCVGCHEMFDNVYQEYRATLHYQNRTGVRASCSDCHVPDPWVHKVVRKVQATKELYHWALGTIDTPEKFESKRLTLAKHVWKAMKETDSRECRNCHSWDAMQASAQKKRASKQHQLAQQEGQTCIDCHKGIAHRPVHTLLGDDDDPYDGRADARSLPVQLAAAEMAPDPSGEDTEDQTATASEPDPEPESSAEPAQAAELAQAPRTEEPAVVDAADAPVSNSQVAAASTESGDWAALEGRKITLFYPGQASIEWALKGSDHGGARAIRKIGDRCAECHEGEQADMGQRMVSGEKAETVVIPGKRAAIEVDVKAAYDAEKLYLQFQWPDGEHTPVPFVEGGKMDPDNPVKLAVMLIPEENEFATQVGCWATCHHDSRFMPDHPDSAALEGAQALAERLSHSDGITKYLQETRSEIEVKGKDGKPRGGWDKLLPPAEVETLLAGSQFIDLVRVKSDGALENGYVLERRFAEGGAEITGGARLADGRWTAELAVPLAGGGAGDLTLEPGKTYTLGVAIHDDFTSARFHHVSLEYRLGFDDAEAEVNAIKR